MGLAFWLYITDFVGNIDGLCLIVSVSYVILLVIVFIGDDADKDYKVLEYFFKKWWILAIAIGISVFIPAQRTMYLMLGASYLSQSNVPDKVSKILDLKLDSIMADLTKASEKKIVVHVKDDK